MKPKTAREFNHRYNGTYVGWNDPDGKVKAVLVRDINDLTEFYAFHEGDRVVARFDDLIFDYPYLGFRKRRGHIFYASRSIQKEYKRGIRSDVITAVNPLTKRRIGITQSVLDTLYTPQFSTDINVKGNIILSPDYALVKFPEYKDRVLLYRMHQVGYERKGTVYFPFLYDFLAEDLTLNDIPTEVVVNGNG